MRWQRATEETAAGGGPVGPAGGTGLPGENRPNSGGRALIPERAAAPPTVVTVYDLGFGEPRRVAEFQLTTAGSVTLTTFGPDECLPAEDWYADGVERYEPGAPEPVLVRPEAGAPFLRALLDLPAMSYYRLVAEDPPTRPEVPGSTSR